MTGHQLELLLQAMEAQTVAIVTLLNEPGGGVEYRKGVLELYLKRSREITKQANIKADPR